ncbi:MULTISPECIES: hypothetical protein [unclassified Guyparkeria]|uniref:hypothetical protein n=1 Tax=unclassified Guyparkeria TaxID=2626246 RepID=UPI0007335672|nr:MULTISPECIES: hypothetical protein [unclassified Guyparkeria]KTG17815.1 hypothetical protein AUR63_06770 [Guyparkeria sp. XI15]OAE89526.1 hypothetical protein AWR35_06780 [Guyparkeria sp. WRN-7]
MLDYFMSSDWAIIATELLAGFFVLSVILAVLVWRGQRRHSDAAERLLDDRDPILKATEEMVGRQIERIWPGMKLDEEQQQIYADRSLDAVEAMVEPWLEPKRHDLSGVARQFQRVRQEDLEQLLSLAREHADASQADDERVTELEQEVEELRTQRDRQANHLNESLETVNVMVREYGRKFDYNEEPHVATVLKAIVMIEEMEAGADCETAQQRAENIFSEDLVASAAPVEETAPAESEDPAAEDSAAAKSESIDAADEMAAAMAMESAASTDTDSIDVGGEQTGRREPTEAMEAATSEPGDSAAATPAPETETETDAGSGDEDIDALIAQAQESTAATAAATEAASASADDGQKATNAEASDTDIAAEPDQPTATATTTAPMPDEPENAGKEDMAAETPAESPAPAAATPEREAPETNESPSETGDEDADDNGVIDLDDVEIPEEEKETSNGDTNEFDLDDIDALLDAEIAKKHGKSQD